MTMTKEQFEQAVREKCPADILPKELQKLDDSYKSYLVLDDFCENRAIIGYADDDTGEAAMYVGTPESFDPKANGSTPQPAQQFLQPKIS
jgi:hypothetical protein